MRSLLPAAGNQRRVSIQWVQFFARLKRFGVNSPSRHEVVENAYRGQVPYPIALSHTCIPDTGHCSFKQLQLRYELVYLWIVKREFSHWSVSEPISNLDEHGEVFTLGLRQEAECFRDGSNGRPSAQRSADILHFSDERTESLVNAFSRYFLKGTHSEDSGAAVTFLAKIFPKWDEPFANCGQLGWNFSHA